MEIKHCIGQLATDTWRDLAFFEQDSRHWRKIDGPSKRLQADQSRTVPGSLFEKLLLHDVGIGTFWQKQPNSVLAPSSDARSPLVASLLLVAMPGARW